MHDEDAGDPAEAAALGAAAILFDELLEVLGGGLEVAGLVGRLAHRVQPVAARRGVPAGT